MNTMHQLLGTWDYLVLGILAGTAALILAGQVFLKSLRH